MAAAEGRAGSGSVGAGQWSPKSISQRQRAPANCYCRTVKSTSIVEREGKLLTLFSQFPTFLNKV
eukprot:2930351-Pleurochrysis_carterae.AAC.1